MSGNVWEWTDSTTLPPRSQATAWVYMSGNAWERTDSERKTLRVVRGGSWLYSASDVRTASRGNYHPHFRSGHNGFRVVRRLPFNDP